MKTMASTINIRNTKQAISIQVTRITERMGMCIHIPQLKNRKRWHLGQIVGIQGKQLAYK